MDKPMNRCYLKGCQKAELVAEIERLRALVDCACKGTRPAAGWHHTAVRCYATGLEPK